MRTIKRKYDETIMKRSLLDFTCVIVLLFQDSFQQRY